MNVTVSDIVGTVLQVVERDDAGIIKEVKASLQKRYYRYCRSQDWQHLRRRTVYTFTGNETTGVALPGDMVNILHVQRETAGSERLYFPGEESARYMLDGRSRWYYVESAITPVISEDAISINMGATTWTGTMSGAANNLYFQIEGQQGIYKITDASSKVFTPAYWGEKIQAKTVILTPATSRRYQVVDYDGVLDSGEIATYYWVLPEPLYQDWQPIILPDSRALELELMIEFIGTNKNRAREVERYQRELEQEAMPKLMSMNPKFIPPQAHLGKTGQRVMMGRRRYSVYPRKY